MHYPLSCRFDEETDVLKSDNIEERMTVLRMSTGADSDTITIKDDVICHDCGAHFAKKYNLKAHRDAFHSLTPNKFICEHCGKEFRYISNYKEHLLVHLNLPRCHKCSECDAAFKTPRGLKSHIKRHATDRNYICEICGKKFGNSNNLKYHKTTHSEQRPHMCELCSCTFKRRGHVYQHQKEVHDITTPTQQYKCHLCRLVFTSQFRLEQHHRKHSGEMPFECKICWRRFSSLKGLKVHQGMSSCDIIPTTCIHCKQTFAPGKEPCDHIKCKQSKLPRAKILKVPRKDRPRNFKCDDCDKTFIFACDQRQHYRTCHTNERPFVCDVCGKGFKARNTLQNHQAGVHLDLRPFPCHICGKAFRRPEQLTLHTRTHTGEKPHLCPICGRGFAQLGDCKKHSKTHEKNNSNNSNNNQ